MKNLILLYFETSLASANAPEAAPVLRMDLGRAWEVLDVYSCFPGLAVVSQLEYAGPGQAQEKASEHSTVLIHFFSNLL